MDSISDFLTVVRNANRQRMEKVDVPISRMKVAILKVLRDEGYIANYKTVELRNRTWLRVFLKYTPDHRQVLQGLERASRPGLRRYAGWRALPRVDGGLGVAVVSTSRGLMTDREARKNRLGGEVICHVR